MRNNEQIIIKRQQRRDSRPQGGGAWKVAFADFTLAMMSLFLVLWILAVSNQEERQIVASRLRDYSIMDNEANPFEIQNSPYPVDLGGQPSVLEEVAPQYTQDGELRPNFPQNKQEARARDEGRSKAAEGYASLKQGNYNDPKQLQVLAGFIEKVGEQMQASNNIELQIVPQGLRILIRDDEKREMYARSSPRITPFFHHLLMALAPIFKRVENPLVISGHTDSTPFAGENYSNWELSADRAMTARRVLLAGGMPASRVAQVMGMADTMLENKGDPKASANRRIELLLLNDKARADLATLFDSQAPESAMAQAVKEARKGLKVE
ncbi:MAG: flagellar motor protein MotB [Aeromonadaceae bacterium]